MRRLPLILILLGGLLLLAASPPALADPGGGRYVVVLRDDASVDSVLARYVRGTSVLDVYRHALNGFAARLTPKALAGLRNDPRVSFVSVDRRVRATGQQIPSGVARIGGGKGLVVAGTQAAGGGVGVAVIDTGIDLGHPDLGDVQKGVNCVQRFQPVSDDNGHGTHVAGIIAARDNGVGVVGVAPAATLYAIKALDANGAGYWSGVICGIDWIVKNRPGLIRVVNMSLAGAGTATPSNLDCSNGNSDALHYAICRATKLGITFVAAAGNSSSDAAGTLPAAYDEVIAVSALADSDGRPGGLGSPPSCYSGQLDDHFATFSNFGAVVDLAAPGVCILSTAMGGGYVTMSGTSMAAPHVAGAAALYLQTHPAALPAEVRSALIAAAEPGPIAGDPDAFHEGVVHVSSPRPADAPAPPVLPLLPLPQLPSLPTLPPLPVVPDLPLLQPAAVSGPPPAAFMRRNA